MTMTDQPGTVARSAEVLLDEWRRLRRDGGLTPAFVDELAFVLEHTHGWAAEMEAHILTCHTPPKDCSMGSSDGAVALDLEAIEARISRASRCPWYYPADGRVVVKLEPGGGVIYPFVDLLHDEKTAGERHDLEKGICEFIAASRTDIPALVAEVRRLRAELAREKGHTREYSQSEAADIDAYNDRLLGENMKLGDERDAALKQLAEAESLIAGFREVPKLERLYQMYVKMRESRDEARAELAKVTAERDAAEKVVDAAALSVVTIDKDGINIGVYRHLSNGDTSISGENWQLLNDAVTAQRAVKEKGK